MNPKVSVSLKRAKLSKTIDLYKIRDKGKTTIFGFPINHLVIQSCFVILNNFKEKPRAYKI